MKFYQIRFEESNVYRREGEGTKGNYFRYEYCVKDRNFDRYNLGINKEGGGTRKGFFIANEELNYLGDTDEICSGE